MALKLKLKPGESIYISGALVKNGPASAELEVLNRVPLLREKDILLQADADTPCKQLYLIVQGLYLDSAGREEGYSAFTRLAAEVLSAAPSTAVQFDKIHELISGGRYYTALKSLRELIEYESKLLENAKRTQ